MIGVFDSGAGGLFALAELRRLLPKADILCLTDRKNAPYGTKSEDELIRLVTSGVDTLLSLGCSSVLMACCTASTVWERLPERERAAAVPIIEPVTEAALRVSKNKKIGILSTEATKKSGAFVKEILKREPSAKLTCFFSGELVSLAESGERDGALSERGLEVVKQSVSGFFESGIDTLILGCTHFAYFENTIKDILRTEVVNSALVGALRMLEYGDDGGGTTKLIG